MRSNERAPGAGGTGGSDQAGAGSDSIVRPTPDISRPYEAAWRSYWAAGWRGVLRLPERAKVWPPTGYTGHNGTNPSYADCQTWADDTEAYNLSLRLPAHVIGIDKDCWDGKTGDASIAAKEAEWGPLPKTWRSTSRGFDTGNGIWLFRIPEGVTLTEQPLKDVEVIQRHHRYVVCWPSIHPNGQRYEWLDERTGQRGGIPSPDDLPELPPTWVESLRSDGVQHTKADVKDGEVADVIAAMPTGPRCHHVAQGAAQVFDGSGRHDGYRQATMAVIGAGRRGCPGVADTLEQMRRTFLADVTNPDQDKAHRRTKTKAEHEWAELIHGAVGIAVAASEQGDHCVDDLTAWVPDGETQQAQPDSDGTITPADVAALRQRNEVLAAAAKIRVQEQAREMIAAEKAAAAYKPPPVVILPDLIAETEAERIVWRWEHLAEVGDRMLIEAAAKTGKTTLLGNVVRSLVTGLPLLDHFPTTPIRDGSQLLYLDTELGPRRLARWLGTVLPDQHRQRVAVWSIAGRAGALDVRDDRIRDRMAAQVLDTLQGAAVGYLVVDVASAWTSPLSIEENDNAAVRAFCEALHTFSLDLGADGLSLAHHAGHNIERSRGASAWRDWPDVYATLTRGSDEGDSGRYLSALGRGIEVPESRLTFDPESRLLSMAGTVGLNRRNAARDLIAAGYVPTVTAVVAANPGMTTRKLRQAVTEALRDEDVTVKAAAVGNAVTKAETDGLIRNAGDGKRADWQPVDTSAAPIVVLGHGGDTPPDASLTVSPRVPTVSPPVSPPVSPTSEDTVSPCPLAYISEDTHGTHTTTDALFDIDGPF